MQDFSRASESNSNRLMKGQNSSHRKLGGCRADAVKGFAHGRGGYHTFLLRGRWDLKQSLSAEIRWKRECSLVLHHRFQNVRQTFGLISIVKVDSGAVNGGR
jgi:hypothetical protein